MTEGSGHDEEMEDLVRTEVLVAGIEDRKLQGVDDAAHGVDAVSYTHLLPPVLRHGSDEISLICMGKIQKQGIAADGLAAVGFWNQHMSASRRKCGRGFAAVSFGTAGKNQNDHKKKERSQRTKKRSVVHTETPFREPQPVFKKAGVKGSKQLQYSRF